MNLELQGKDWDGPNDTVKYEIELPLKLAQKLDHYTISPKHKVEIARIIEGRIREWGEPIPRGCPDCYGPTAWSMDSEQVHWCSDCGEYYTAEEAIDQSELLAHTISNRE